MRQERTRVRLLTLLAVITVCGALGSVGDTANSIPIPSCQNNADCGCTNLTNCTAPGQGGTCMITNFTSQTGFCVCNAGYGGPTCQPLGACCGIDFCAQQPNTGCAASGSPCTDLTEMQCRGFNGTFAGNGTTCSSGICDPTHTPTATATGTATQTATASQTATVTQTPTNTPVPQGGGCTDASQCVPGLFCSDDVCCDTACSGPLVRCDQPGREGVCSSIAAQAPAASNSGLLAMVGVLIAIGVAAMALRRAR